MKKIKTKIIGIFLGILAVNLLVPVLSTAHFDLNPVSIEEASAQTKPTLEQCRINSFQNGCAEILAANPTGATDPKTGQPVSTTGSTDANKQMDAIVRMLIVVEKGFLALNVPILMMVGKLMSNEWVYLDGEMFGMIQTLWRVIRNIVNIIFAVMLIVMAFSQIVGAFSGNESKSLAIKSALPKFIFALIFVNFSLLTCKLILDVGNLATTAAFSIVNEVSPSLFTSGNDATWATRMFCWPNQKGVDAIGNDTKKDPNAWTKGPFTGDAALGSCIGNEIVMGFGEKNAQSVASQVKPDTLTKNDDFAMGWKGDHPTSTSLFGARNAMFVYSYSILRMGGILSLYDNKFDNFKIGTVSGVALTTILTVVYGAMILLINITLLIILGIRLVLIWLILIFSPLMAFELFPEGSAKIKSFVSSVLKKNGIFKSLIDLAMMPAILGAVLSLGFIIFHVMTSVMAKTMSTKGITSTLSIPPFTVSLIGSPLPFFATFQEFILAVLMLIILWQAIFQVMKTDTIMDGVVDKVNGLGKSVVSSAKMIPFIPLPGVTGKDGSTKVASLAGFNQGIRKLEDKISMKEAEQGQDLFGDSNIGKFLGYSDKTKKLEEKADQLMLRLDNNEEKDLRTTRVEVANYLLQGLNTKNDKVRGAIIAGVNNILTEKEQEPIKDEIKMIKNKQELSETQIRKVYTELDNSLRNKDQTIQTLRPYVNGGSEAPLTSFHEDNEEAGIKPGKEAPKSDKKDDAKKEADPKQAAASNNPTAVTTTTTSQVAPHPTKAGILNLTKSDNTVVEINPTVRKLVDTFIGNQKGLMKDTVETTVTKIPSTISGIGLSDFKALVKYLLENKS